MADESIPRRRAVLAYEKVGLSIIPVAWIAGDGRHQIELSL